MDLSRAALLRELVTGTNLGIRTAAFAHALRRHTTRHRGLLMFGPADDEPWHLTAHLDEETSRAGLNSLRPSLVRWSPPAGAPPHLAIGLDRLHDAGHGESLLVVSERSPTAGLLERVDDARRRGATVFSIDGADSELVALSHESLTPKVLFTDGSGLWLPRRITEDAVHPSTVRSATRTWAPTFEFETAEHLVSLAVAADDGSQSGWRTRLRQIIERLGG